MQSIIQIIKINEARSGISKTSGKPWEMQDCECILLNVDGTPEQVGVLMLPKDLTGKAAPGTYLGSFALRADTSREGGRRINAVLTGLQPYGVKGTPSQQPAKVPQ